MSTTAANRHDVCRDFHEGDGSFLAFFEVPATAFEFKARHDFDLHIALAVESAALAPMMQKARAQGVEVRGVSDHGFIDSISLRDPDGYVIELCAPKAGSPMNAANARRVLQDRQASKPCIG